MKLVLPRKEHLTALKFDYIDSTIDQYYRPIQGNMMRKRLVDAMRLIPDKKVDRILDVGYGGGQFIPTLSQIAKEPIYGIDTLPQPERVAKILEKEGYKSNLIEGSVFEMPYEDNFFDGIVCISVMEHFEGDELNRATREMYRVLKPGGWLVFGSPAKNPMTDFIIDKFLGFKPDDIHPSGHREILNGINAEVDIDKVIHFFWWMPLNYSLYFCARVIKEEETK